MQEVRWRGAGTRTITGKDTQYKLFWVGNQKGNGGVGVMLAEKWIQKVIHVNRVNDRLMLLKVLVGKRVVTIISTYAPQQGLSDDAKEKFYADLILHTSKVDEKEVIILGGDMNGHVGKTTAGYEDAHGGFGYGVRNAEGERILEFGLALDMVACNTLFSKRNSRLITYSSDGVNTQIDYSDENSRQKDFVGCEGNPWRRSFYSAQVSCTCKRTQTRGCPESCRVEICHYMNSLTHACME